MALSYLFECIFKDGTVLKQTQEDTSILDSSRSMFYDVVQRLGDVSLFRIVNQHHSYTVDLRDGHFEVDGALFFLNETPQDCVFRLIYFRRHQQNTTLGQSSSHSVEYHIGWQTNLNGRNVKQTILVK